MQRTNFKMEDSNITMIKGDTVAFNVIVYDSSESPMMVDSAYLTCKKVPSREEIVFQKYLGNGITQENEMMSVRIAPEDTRDVDAGQYFYDLQIGVGSDIYTILNGSLQITQDVTF